MTNKMKQNNKVDKKINKNIWKKILLFVTFPVWALPLVIWSLVSDAVDTNFEAFKTNK